MMQIQEPLTSQSLRKSLSIQLHEEAMQKAKNYRRCEAELLEVLIRVEKKKIYLEFEVTSLHQYAVDVLNLPSQAAYDFTAVMAKSEEVPALLEAIYLGQTTISKIRKICSVVTPKNQKEWIDLTIHCSCRVVERAVAMTNPREAVKESLKYVAGNVLELKLGVSEEWAELLKATKDRLSQQKRRAVSTEEALFILMTESHKRNDPVEKAKRAKARSQATANANPNSNANSNPNAKTETQPLSFESGDQVLSRDKIDEPKAQSERNINGPAPANRPRHRPAEVRHEVTLRDQGQCVHVYPSGSRCENRRWLDQHHMTEFAKGGEHTLENLETLCRAHHRQRHMH